jgi:hypothetical protein
VESNYLEDWLVDKKVTVLIYFTEVCCEDESELKLLRIVSSGVLCYWQLANFKYLKSYCQRVKLPFIITNL